MRIGLLCVGWVLMGGCVRPRGARGNQTPGYVLAALAWSRHEQEPVAARCVRAGVKWT
jgi:hypothetical protein